jgi:hypothetical protein
MNARFFGTLDAQSIEGKWWRLLSPLGFYSARYDVTLCAPAGFVTDFASVPRIPFAYLLTGNTGHWEAVIHDLPYRFGNFPRLKTDMVFNEAGHVRSAMREDQAPVVRAGRWIRTTGMTAVVLALGRGSFRAKPGCLDDRQPCNQVCRIDAEKCGRYYPAWRSCVMPGYHPEILKLHGG